MSIKENYQKRITILLNSCDSYKDTWDPFFSLLKKYWNPSGTEILLNTESENFSFEGLNIKCIHPPKKLLNKSYSERLYNCLNYVKTEYVVLMLDDFFLREKTDDDRISRIIDWMDEDKDIVYFNCDYRNKTYFDYEVNKYPGFKRLPIGNQYTLSMQAAVWRTDKLKKYWRFKVSPWEWEVYSNYYTNTIQRDKFYMPLTESDCFLHYRPENDSVWPGISRGKWIKEDVVPLFQKEGINVDFSLRGFYEESENKNEVLPGCYDNKKYNDLIRRSLGNKQYIHYLFFRVKKKIKKYNFDFFQYLQEKGRKKFISKTS